MAMVRYQGAASLLSWRSPRRAEGEDKMAGPQAALERNGPLESWRDPHSVPLPCGSRHGRVGMVRADQLIAGPSLPADCVGSRGGTARTAAPAVTAAVTADNGPVPAPAKQQARKIQRASPPPAAAAQAATAGGGRVLRKGRATPSRPPPPWRRPRAGGCAIAPSPAPQSSGATSRSVPGRTAAAHRQPQPRVRRRRGERARRAARFTSPTATSAPPGSGSRPAPPTSTSTTA